MPIPIHIVSWITTMLGMALAVRLALTSHRERSLPEGLVSVFFFGGNLGYWALLIPATLDASEETRGLGLELSNWLFLIPHFAMLFFTWRVFRPTSRWAAVAAWTLSLVAVAQLAISQWAASQHGSDWLRILPWAMPLFASGILVRGAAFGWAATEALLYYTAARRRLAIGLGDPLVCNRFLLWTIWSGMAIVILVLRVIAILTATPSDHHEAAWLTIGQLLAGCTILVAIWLTFAPPAFYRRWIGARHAAGQAQSES